MTFFYTYSYYSYYFLFAVNIYNTHYSDSVAICSADIKSFAQMNLDLNWVIGEMIESTKIYILDGAFNSSETLETSQRIHQWRK